MTDTLEAVGLAIRSHQCTFGPRAHVYRMSDGKIVEQCDSDLDVMAAMDRWNARAAILETLRGMMEPSEEMYSEALRYLRTDCETNVWAAWQAMLTQKIKEVEGE